MRCASVLLVLFVALAAPVPAMGLPIIGESRRRANAAVVSATTEGRRALQGIMHARDDRHQNHGSRTHQSGRQYALRIAAARCRSAEVSLTSTSRQSGSLRS